MNKRLTLKLAASLTLLLPITFVPLPTAAQDIPKKTINLVVGFAAGGAADAAARVIAKKLQENMGQIVVVDNRAGAGGNIAHQFVAKAEPDGATILLGSIGPLTIAPHLMKLAYNPLKDLAPLTMGVAFPNVLVVHQGVGVKTLSEYITKAKAHPGTMDYASTGAGSASHLAGELLNQRAGIEAVHIPYKGGAPALQDMLGGRVASYFAAPPTAAPHIESGKLVPIATTGLTRSASMPNVPTVAESGYPGFNATNWYAFVAPGKTPTAVLDRWNRELVKVLNAPDVKLELDKLGLSPAPCSREDLGKFIASEFKTWGELVRARKIKSD
jgi:tripartite-type tricarboxylate transporter receptor subunit TctC